MTEEIIFAGFGGQGVLSMGKFLCYAGIMENKEVTWMPSYGPEMRGGTANVTVILSDSSISSPILNVYDSAIVLNQQSVDKFEEKVKPGGLLLYETTGITNPPRRQDINIYSIDAVNQASKLGSSRVFNMVVLGAYIKIKPVVAFDSLVEGLHKSLPQRYHHLMPMNEKAIKSGWDIVHEEILVE
jgi:2-oxoglutarate ferredoxin oxidoreductase subunit gamma